jgi:DNA replication and repair protein RecF
MHLLKLSGSGFRNLCDFALEFDQSRNIFTGSNGAGKTNLLEAIHYLCIGRSMRIGIEESQLIGFSSTLLRLEGEAETLAGRLAVEAGLCPAEKRLKVNGEIQQRLSGLIGRLPVVSLSPEDDELCKSGPGVRRRFLDLAIAQFSRSYLADLQEYRRLLAQRNRLLADWRDGHARGEGLDAWNQQLHQCGARIIAKRLAAIERLAGLSSGRYRDIASGRERLEIAYRFSFRADPGEGPGDALLRALLSNTAFERSRGMTMYGPHRDDLAITIDGRPVRNFGSQGQQRSAAIALKLAEADLLGQELGEQPVILLDEIFAELDSARAANLVGQLDPGCQVFIASAHDNGLSDAFAIKRFRIESGNIPASC